MADGFRKIYNYILIALAGRFGNYIQADLADGLVQVNSDRFDHHIIICISALKSQYVKIVKLFFVIKNTHKIFLYTICLRNLHKKLKTIYKWKWFLPMPESVTYVSNTMDVFFTSIAGIWIESHTFNFMFENLKGRKVFRFSWQWISELWF